MVVEYHYKRNTVFCLQSKIFYWKQIEAKMLKMFLITWHKAINWHRPHFDRRVSQRACFFAVEKYRKCEPLAASDSTKATDPLINLDSKKKHVPASVLALSPFLFDLVITSLQVNNETVVCVSQVILQISKPEWLLWSTSSRYNGMTTTWSCSRWEYGHVLATMIFINTVFLENCQIDQFVCVFLSGHSYSDPGETFSRSHH